MTGQLIKPSAELASEFERKDSALKAWMDEALELKIPVIYISLGTMVKW